MIITTVSYQFGIVVGLILLSYVPFLIKKQKNVKELLLLQEIEKVRELTEEEKLRMAELLAFTWDHWYTINLIYSWILSIICMAFIYQQNPIDVSLVNAGDAFLQGLTLGVASVPTLKYVRQLLEMTTDNEAESP